MGGGTHIMREIDVERFCFCRRDCTATVSSLMAATRGLSTFKHHSLVAAVRLRWDLRGFFDLRALRG